MHCSFVFFHMSTEQFATGLIKEKQTHAFSSNFSTLSDDIACIFHCYIFFLLIDFGEHALHVRAANFKPHDSQTI